MLALNAVYDSGGGYDARSLWCGLAMSNATRPDPHSIGTVAEWHALLDRAHKRGLKVMTWFNPSYFHTGSSFFKQAERDVKTHGLSALPAASPARWFRWSNQSSELVKPADDEPSGDGEWNESGDEGALFDDEGRDKKAQTETLILRSCQRRRSLSF